MVWRKQYMAKSGKNRQRRDWRRITFLVISVLIVLSMLLSMAIAFAPPAP
jgi:predicted nucleic acid-binding Zn ribbon protein